MVFKFIALAAFVASANAGVLHSAPLAYQSAQFAPLPYTHSAPLAYAAPVAKTLVAADSYEHEYDSYPQYSYSYNVHDTLTGDAKSQQETRNGDAVEGSYSFIEADGSRRVVHYTADDQNGFNAVVEKQQPQVAVKAVAPAVHVKTIAPAVYQHAAPVAHATYAAPAYYDHGYSAPVLAHSYHH